MLSAMFINFVWKVANVKINRWTINVEKKVLNPFTAKIWLLILPSSCDSLPCTLVTSGSYRVNIWNFKAAADNSVDVSNH